MKTIILFASLGGLCCAAEDLTVLKPTADGVAPGKQLELWLKNDRGKHRRESRGHAEHHAGISRPRPRPDRTRGRNDPPGSPRSGRRRSQDSARGVTPCQINSRRSF
jgi:hypothetical protein